MTGMHFVMDLPWLDALYYTIITLSTVGFESPDPLSSEGKIFIIFLIVSGIGIAGYAIGSLGRFFIGERLLLYLGKGEDRKVKNMKDHWILCGLGTFGMEIATLLLEEETPFVAIELDTDRVTEARTQDILVVQGDAKIDNTLLQAGIEKAKGIIISLEDEADAVYATLTARALNHEIRIVAKAESLQEENLMYRSGADKVINPVIAGASSIVRASLQPSVADFLELVGISKKLDLDFGTVTVLPQSYMVGQTLSEAPIRSVYEATVIAVIKPDGRVIHNPNADLRIKENDQLIIFGHRKQIAKLRQDVSCIECKDTLYGQELPSGQ
jgi:voltage-gated potassium channel